MKVVGSGYLLSRNAFASHESGNLSAHALGSPKKDREPTSYLGMSGSKERVGALFGGGAFVLGLGGASAGAPGGGTGGRVGAGV